MGKSLKIGKLAPRIAIAIAAMLGVGLLALSWRGVETVRTHHEVLSFHIGEVGRLDAELTAAARLYAETGDEAYAARYDENQGQLDALSRFIRGNAKGAQATEAVEAFYATGRALYAYEIAAMAAAEEGDLAAAKSIIDSDAYLARKDQYIQSYRDIAIAVQDRSHALSQWIIGAILALMTASFGFAAYLLVQSHRLRQARVQQTHFRQLAEVSQRNEALQSKFLANVSHELRTPLNGVMGMAEALKIRAKDNEERGYLEVIIASSKNLLTLINDLLDLSQLESGHVQLRPVEADPRSVLSGIQDALSFQAEEKGLSLQVETAGDIAPLYRFDPDRLRQIVTNLAGNAVKFTDSGSVTLRLTGEADGFRVEVEDTGPGIDAADQAGVFDRFKQADSTHASGGTGLGLAITQELVQLMGGAVGLESTPGVGSRFWVSVPAEAVSQAARLEGAAA